MLFHYTYTQYLRYNICSTWFLDIRKSTCESKDFILSTHHVIMNHAIGINWKFYENPNKMHTSSNFEIIPLAFKHDKIIPGYTLNTSTVLKAIDKHFHVFWYFMVPFFWVAFLGKCINHGQWSYLSGVPTLVMCWY